MSQPISFLFPFLLRTLFLKRALHLHHAAHFRFCSRQAPIASQRTKPGSLPVPRSIRTPCTLASQPMKAPQVAARQLVMLLRNNTSRNNNSSVFIQMPLISD
ncbi:hypothetical protein GQ54DRAFT_23847 [Martensiomyces pterosporus]|nr:hypothetical protein GQ54DRAFT_23847 [Martensiomyces pterosporus]